MTIAAVAGASGFVGRRLAVHLAAAGVEVRALVRRPGSGPHGRGISEVAFDLGAGDPAPAALAGVDVAYYLIHAMAAGAGFEERDRLAAQRFARAAAAAGIRHVVYLGGLHPAGTALSAHLASRAEVGEILRTGCGALVVRAGVVLGAGSASFEIMRDLVRHLPVMTAPRWVESRCQPVHIDDVVETLARAATVPGGREVDLAGPDVLTYREMLLRLGAQLHHRPVIVTVPVLSPGLSARWLRFVTSADLSVARALVDSLRHDALATGADLCREVGVIPVEYSVAIDRILAEEAALTGRATGVSRWWRQGRYHRVQSFRFEAASETCDAATAPRIDAALLDHAGHALPGVGRHGDDLHLGPLTLIRLGPAHTTPGRSGWRLHRTIQGGLLCGRPGGEVGFDCRTVTVGMDVDAVIDGYSPRLPRWLYRLVQEPYHRRLVARAVLGVVRPG